MNSRLSWMRTIAPLNCPLTVICAQVARHIIIAVATAIPTHPAASAPLPLDGASAVTSGPDAAVQVLLEEALAHNPQIAAARAESDAARLRIAPSSTLEDPMLEAGIINAPVPFSLHRDDMTMKMLGLSQKIPFPGKRNLRRDVATDDAISVDHATDETINRILRDVRLAYEELRMALISRRLAGETSEALQQLVSVAQARYSVGQVTQSDPLQAQIQVVRMQQEILGLDREETARLSELRQLLGRGEEAKLPVVPTRATLLDLPDTPEALVTAAEAGRPQLKSLAALIDKSDHQLALARREYYPDFEIRLGYGQRDRTSDGMPRDNMVTLTVAINLPLWRKDRLEPRVAEALAMRRQAQKLTEEQHDETRAELERDLASEKQQRASATLYRSTLLPQTEAAFDSALNAYRVGRVDFTTLLEARMRVYETELAETVAIANHNKAIVEIDYLTGRTLIADTLEAQHP